MTAAVSATDLDPTGRTTLKRLPDRGSYDRTVIDPIVDEALICHLGFVHDGQPFVLPTIHARVGDTVYVHGSVASRMLRSFRDGVAACSTVTLLDGIVAARSGFHSSMNYRSVLLLGTPRLVEDEAEKTMALDAVVEHVLPGRTAELRPNLDVETKQTHVLAFAIAEGSAKVRTGGPKDDDEDLGLDIWAGVIPLTMVAGQPLDAPDLKAGIAPPSYVTEYGR